MKKLLVSAFGMAMLAACAPASEGGAVPAVDGEGLEAAQVITNTNADGTWTANANKPVEGFDVVNGPSGLISASAWFDGPAGKTRRMGVCLLQMTDTPCNGGPQTQVNAECGSSPSSLPSGGFRYCAAPNGEGQKYCAFRPGSGASYCDGTPRYTGLPAVQPGYYGVQDKPMVRGREYISYACFEGCAASDPSSSSPAGSACMSHRGDENYRQCWDMGCDGVADYCKTYDGMWVMMD